MSLETLCAEKIRGLATLCTDNSANPELQKRARVLQETFTKLSVRTTIDEQICSDLLDAMHRFQRLQFLYHVKATGETIAVLDEVAKREPYWNEIAALPVDASLRQQLAGKLLHAAFQHEMGGQYPDRFQDTSPLNREKAILVTGLPGRGTAEHIVSYMLRHNIPMDIDFVDPLFKKAIIEHSDEARVAALGAYQFGKSISCNKHIRIGATTPQETATPSTLDPQGNKMKLFREAMKPLQAKMRSGEMFYTLTMIPTPDDAKIDNIPYQDYLKLFFELCDQPWNAIQKANEHLIESLEQAKTLHIADEDTGTDLTMNITGKRWANSVVLKNIPGSEVFASPVRESVNGKLVSKGRFEYRDGETIEDMTLIFKNGRVVDFDAVKGKEFLAKIIEADDGQGEGSRFVGEIGIGTNPWLKQHVINGLLVEKISGSAHIALGNAYTFKNYDGKDVMLDNGNRSATSIHWDITTMLQGPKSRIVVDEGTPQEEAILRTGKFTHPALRILNEGWAAIPEKDRPSYWRKLLAERSTTADVQRAVV